MAGLAAALALCVLLPAARGATVEAVESPTAAQRTVLLEVPSPVSSLVTTDAGPLSLFESPEQLPRVDVLPEAAVAEQLDSAPTLPTRRAAIPFRTQRDGSRWAGSNCGPAALGMILEARGIVENNDHLRYLAHTYQGTVGMRTGTALQHMARVSEDYGIPTRGLYAGEAFRRWTVEDVRAEVAQENPVVALVKYRLLPGREAAAVRFDHYIVLWDLTPDGFVYNDSAYVGADEGYSRTLTSAQLDAAMAPTLVPRQAVAFVLGG